MNTNNFGVSSANTNVRNEFVNDVCEVKDGPGNECESIQEGASSASAGAGIFSQANMIDCTVDGRSSDYNITSDNISMYDSGPENECQSGGSGMSPANVASSIDIGNFSRAGDTGISPVCIVIDKMSESECQLNGNDMSSANVRSGADIHSQANVDDTTNEYDDALFQLHEIVTPVQVDRLAFWLEGYDEEEKQILLDGFAQGFSIGCDDRPNIVNSVRNQKPALEKPEVLEKLLKKEIEARRIAGPYTKPPFENLHVSPLSLRPKKVKDEYRLIHNLSAPFGDSVNAGIDESVSTVQYETVDMAIEYIQKFGAGAYLAKSDIRKAFRNLPIKPADRLLLGMEHKNQWFFDKTLAMGCSSSCALFEKLSRALQWICKVKLGIKCMCHVLDDFIFINMSETLCGNDLDKFKMLCTDIGVPLAAEKTFGPDQILEFLGILLDTLRMQASLPEEKIEKCKNEICKLLPKKVKKVKVKQLQSVIGLLNFACRVVSPGRAFLRRLIDRICGVSSGFHRVRITQGMKEDLKMWIKFLVSFNGTCMFSQPKWLCDEDLHLYSDSCKRGYGATLGTKWFCGNFPTEAFSLNITILELFPILLSVVLFKDVFTNKRVHIHTDNKDLISVISKKTSKEKEIMPLVRELVLQTMNFNVILKPTHIRGQHNGVCDALSRSQFQRFRKLAPHMDIEPILVPEHLLPSRLFSRLMKK